MINFVKCFAKTIHYKFCRIQTLMHLFNQESSYMTQIASVSLTNANSRPPLSDKITVRFWSGVFTIFGGKITLVDTYRMSITWWMHYQSDVATQPRGHSSFKVSATRKLKLDFNCIFHIKMKILQSYYCKE